MNEAQVDHLRQMLALHERAAKVADTPEERRASKECAADYAATISRLLREERRP